MKYFLTDSITSEPRPSVHIHPLDGGGIDTIMFSPNNFHLKGLPHGDIDKDSFAIFQSQIVHESKSASTLHLLMNTNDHDIYFGIMESTKGLEALESLISNSSLSTDSYNFNKIVTFLNRNTI